MDILTDRDQKLERYLQAPLRFVPLSATTCSVSGLLANVDFQEEQIAPFLQCSGNIVAIDCNFCHKTSEPPKVEPPDGAPRRGRHKKIKERKQRRHAGDGSSFNSQITFTIRGRCLRVIPPLIDQYSANSIKLPDGRELVEKKYKIKLFRNGSLSIPGVLAEDFSDITEPLNELCEYLKQYLDTEITVARLGSVMRNFKTRLIDNQIDVDQLQQYCERHFNNLLNTSFDDIVKYLTNPEFKETNNSPIIEGWNNVFFSENLENVEVDFSELRHFLHESTAPRNLHVNFDKLVEKLASYPLSNYYSKLREYWAAVDASFISLDNKIYQGILRHMLHPVTKELRAYLMSSQDNRISHTKYDPEKYSGFLIKIKTPNATSTEKCTTIKIFKSGKVNIDGANSREEADFIFYWLNDLFYNNPSLIYDDSFDYDAPDSEFSSDSEED
jgi:Transcription factor TFIID (or TATA-binding protein, TBP)